MIIWALEVLLGIAHSQSVANCTYRNDESMNEAFIVQKLLNCYDTIMSCLKESNECAVYISLYSWLHLFISFPLNVS